ncbi:MAG: CgeB family protein [Acidobacteriaceae bacterium]
MPPSLRIAYLAHSLRSDWNNGNAHFLRGLARALTAMGHDIAIFEQSPGWSSRHLIQEPRGANAISQFEKTYPELRISTYTDQQLHSLPFWRNALADREIVILHEWNPPELANILLDLRNTLGFRLLFHDTHHRASSSPEEIRLFRIDRFDAVLAFGDALRRIYQDQLGIRRVWTFHEAADTTVFRPRPHTSKTSDVVWIGNWGDDERSDEICEFLLKPAMSLRDHSFSVYGVRYPPNGVAALLSAGVRYGGYLPNLDAPTIYAAARVTLHIPRQQYATAMHGIPTIRVFEALACGIPLISAPWDDTEHLFRKGDIAFAGNSAEMKLAILRLLSDNQAAEQQASQGFETVLAHHTCAHRARQLTSICEELLK